MISRRLISELQAENTQLNTLFSSVSMHLNNFNDDQRLRTAELETSALRTQLSYLTNKLNVVEQDIKRLSTKSQVPVQNAQHIVQVEDPSTDGMRTALQRLIMENNSLVHGIKSKAIGPTQSGNGVRRPGQNTSSMGSALLQATGIQGGSNFAGSNVRGGFNPAGSNFRSGTTLTPSGYVGGAMMKQNQSGLTASFGGQGSNMRNVGSSSNMVGFGPLAVTGTNYGVRNSYDQPKPQMVASQMVGGMTYTGGQNQHQINQAMGKSLYNMATPKGGVTTSNATFGYSSGYGAGKDTGMRVSKR